jgi:hypothetical protein
MVQQMKNVKCQLVPNEASLKISTLQVNVIFSEKNPGYYKAQLKKICLNKCLHNLHYYKSSDFSIKVIISFKANSATLVKIRNSVYICSFKIIKSNT